mmetsp:Transcript_38738/g.111969  ORF Transcript_38738/g.111969 Transcript_38738/m.111969 type:complete len:175 (+) Transcript_38738:69-593(+)
MATFAEVLTGIVRQARRDETERRRQAEQWLAHEGRLLDKAVEAFKVRCLKAAEEEKCEAAISFEVLTRDIVGFPTRTVANSTILVDSWGAGAAAGWFYASRGTSEEWSQGTPVNFAALLESMMPKFVEKVEALGFQKCARIPGTWKVSACWSPPGGGGNGEPPEKKAKKDKGGS